MEQQDDLERLMREIDLAISDQAPLRAKVERAAPRCATPPRLARDDFAENAGPAGVIADDTLQGQPWVSGSAVARTVSFDEHGAAAGATPDVVARPASRSVRAPERAFLDFARAPPGDARPSVSPDNAFIAPVRAVHASPDVFTSTSVSDDVASGPSREPASDESESARHARARFSRGTEIPAEWLAAPERVLSDLDPEEVLSSVVVRWLAGMPRVPTSADALRALVRTPSTDLVDWHERRADRVLASPVELDWARWSGAPSPPDMVVLLELLERAPMTGLSVGALDVIVGARVTAVDRALADELRGRAGALSRTLLPHMPSAQVRQWLLLDRLAATLARLDERCDRPSIQVAAEATWRTCRQQDRECWSAFVTRANLVRARAGMTHAATVAEWWARVADPIRKEVTRALAPMVDELVRNDPVGELAQLRRRVDRDEAVLDITNVLYAVSPTALHALVTKAERRAAAFARHHPKV